MCVVSSAAQGVDVLDGRHWMLLLAAWMQLTWGCGGWYSSRLGMGLCMQQCEAAQV